mgnify:CR=1 FL=1
MTKQYELTGNAEPPVDPRDHDYISPFMPEELPASLDLRFSCVDLVNQLDQDACVANGHYFDLHRKVPSFVPSRQFMHNSTKVLGGYVGQSGVVVRDGLQALSSVGVCRAAYYPYNSEYNNTVPDDDVYELAKPHTINDYEAVIPVGPHRTEQEKVHNICSALNEGMIVGLGIRVTSSIHTLTGPWQQHDYQVESDNNIAIGRHYMYIVGYDMATRMFLLANWWGEGHGDEGYLGLPFEVVNSLRPEAWCIRYFKEQGTPERSGIYKNLLMSSAFSARLQVSEAMHGTTTNIWVGAVLPSGQTLIKHSQEDDSWLPIEQGLVPYLTDYPLKKVNMLSLVTYRPGFRDAFAGTEFYAGYGDTAASMSYNKVWTIT